MRFSPLATLAALVASTSLALADPVSVESGLKESSGQGWLFKDSASGFCGVVTATHVARPQGAVRPILVRTRSGLEGVGTDVHVLSPAPDGDTAADSFDVTLMRIVGPISDRGCTTATLGTTAVRYLLSHSRRGLLTEISSSDETTRQEVNFLADAQQDERRLSLRASRAGDVIQQGMSGSVVTEVEDDRVSEGLKPLPLAMVTMVDPEGKTAAAIRFDVVRDLVLAALSRPAPMASSPGADLQVRSWSGETLDVGCPGLNALVAAASCGWRTRTVAGQRAISLLLDAGGQVLSSLQVQIGKAPDGQRVILEALADVATEDWRFVKAGEIKSGVAEIRFSPIQAQRLRVSITGTRNQPMEIRVAVGRTPR